CPVRVGGDLRPRCEYLPAGRRPDRTWPANRTGCGTDRRPAANPRPQTQRPPARTSTPVRTDIVATCDYFLPFLPPLRQWAVACAMLSRPRSSPTQLADARGPRK